MATVIVKPIEKPKWYKNEQANFIIRPTKFQCAVDKNTRKYLLDCSEEERLELQDITGFDLSLNFKMTENHPFFDEEISHITLKHGINIFNTDDPLDRIKLYILKGHPMVANSVEEYEKTKNPEYKFIIYNEEEEDKIKSSKKAVKRNAILELSKLPTDRKIEVYRIMTGKELKNQSVEFIDMKLEEVLEKETERFLRIINTKPEDLTTQSLIIQLINARILSKEGDIIKYGDFLIGSDMTTAIAFMKDKKNQPLKLQLQEKLQ